MCRISRKALPTCVNAWRAALRESPLQALRGASGGVADPAADSFGASWSQPVEPCDQFGHVGPGCLIPHRGPLLKACPSMLYPRASRVGSLDKPLRNLHCFLISSPFPLTEEFLNDSTCGPARTDVRAVADEPRLNTGIRQCHCAEIPTDPSQPVLQIMNMGGRYHPRRRRSRLQQHHHAQHHQPSA